ncbi:hypothetical protein ANCCEY_02670 [Ancylostoma ceylanicum]|nr:hypothetical protein ANCCEY_02670 [Ancylostoma ceylanicum]
MDEWGLKRLEWPAESPDLNPIELVWGNMKNFIRGQKVRTLAELEVCIRAYWKALTPEKCRKYVESVQWRMKKIIEAGGGNIIECKPRRGLIEAENSQEDSDSNDSEEDHNFW